MKLIPNLKIIHLEDIVDHETTDPSRIARLEKRFRTVKIFTNPPLVARLGRDKFVLLDGANRVAVARKLHFRDIVVQIIDYRNPAVSLDKWNHIVELPDWADWWQKIENIFAKSLIALPGQSRGNLRSRQFIAYLHSSNGGWHGVRAPKNEMDRLSSINTLVGTYRGKYRFFRVANERLSDIRNNDKVRVLVIFPNFTKKDILHFARCGYKIPCGISRHIIPQRALRVNLPFSVLRSKETLAKKNFILKRHIAILLTNNRVRLYSEPVYLYDE
ncbi:MAG: hypothetical protein V1668_01040 [Patescibacteria group bacterium]